MIATEVVKRIFETLTRRDVHPSRRLVEEQDRGARIELASQCQTLPLPHAQLLAARELTTQLSVETLRERIHNLVGAREEESVGKTIGIGGRMDIAEGNILTGSKVEIDIILKKGADVATEVVKIVSADVNTVDKHGAILRVV